MDNIKAFINLNYENLKVEAKEKVQTMNRTRSKKSIPTKSRAPSEDIPSGGQIVRFGH